MSDRDVRRVAQILAGLKTSVEGQTRARQLPSSSVTLEDGTQKALVDGLNAGVDALIVSESQAEEISSLGDVSTDGVLEQSAMPDRMDAIANGVNAAFEVGVNAVARVAEAHAQAEEAAEKAASAQSTADGKNSRRRGKTEPEAPEAGWAQGDQWVVENDAGKPVAIRVWNGTEWVGDQILADELLVAGENGTVRIADGKVTAQSLAVDALDFKTGRGMYLYGALVEGGRLKLADILSETVVKNPSTSSVAGWSSANGAVPVVVAGEVAGSKAIESGNGYLVYDFAPEVQYTSIEARVWVATLAQVFLVSDGGPGISFEVPGATWTTVQVDSENALKANAVAVIAAADTTVRVANLKLIKRELSDGLALERDGAGIATLASKSPLGNVYMRRGQVIFSDPVTAYQHSTFLNRAGIAADEEFTIAARKVRFAGPTVFDGDTDWAYLTLPATVSGSARWQRRDGKIYLEYNVTAATTVAADGLLNPAFSLPSVAWPGMNAAVGVVGSGTRPALAWISASTGNCTIRNLHAGPIATYYGSGSWIAKPT